MPDDTRKKQLIVPEGCQPPDKITFWPVLVAFSLVGGLSGFLIGVSQSPVIAPFLTGAGGVGAGLCVVWFSRKSDEEREVTEIQKRHLAYDVSAFVLFAFIGVIGGAELRTHALRRDFFSERPLKIKEYVAAGGHQIESEDVAKLLFVQTLLTASGVDRDEINGSLRLLIDETGKKVTHYEEQKRVAETDYVKAFLKSSKEIHNQSLNLSQKIRALEKVGQSLNESFKRQGGSRDLTELLDECKRCQASIGFANDAFERFGNNESEMMRIFHSLETIKLGKPTAIDNVLSRALDVFYGKNIEGKLTDRVSLMRGEPTVCAPCAYRIDADNLWSGWGDSWKLGVPAPPPADAP